MENKGSDSSKLIRSYLRVLLLNFYRFFSKDCVLNSDGRKLLNDIAREVAKCEPHLMELVKKVRKIVHVKIYMRTLALSKNSSTISFIEGPSIIFSSHVTLT